MITDDTTNSAAVGRFIETIADLVNETGFYPRCNVYLDAVLLALLSKSLAVGSAVRVLVEAGFPEEAFGLSRTLIDLYLTTRYITNRDASGRADKFAGFSAKEKQGWDRISQKYYGRPATTDARRRSEILNEARQYPHPHWWTGRGDHTKQMALEDDTYEIDAASGKPLTAEFDYEVVYKWTSYYVHPTASSLDSHAVQRGQRFSIHARKGEGMRVGTMALFNTVVQVYKILLRVFRVLRVDVPEEISTQFTVLARGL